MISAQHKMAPVSLWLEAALQTWVAAQALRTTVSPAHSLPLDLSALERLTSLLSSGALSPTWAVC